MGTRAQWSKWQGLALKSGKINEISKNMTQDTNISLYHGMYPKSLTIDTQLPTRVSSKSDSSSNFDIVML